MRLRNSRLWDLKHHQKRNRIGFNRCPRTETRPSNAVSVSFGRATTLAGWYSPNCFSAEGFATQRASCSQNFLGRVRRQMFGGRCYTLTSKYVGRLCAFIRVLVMELISMYLSMLGTHRARYYERGIRSGSRFLTSKRSITYPPITPKEYLEIKPFRCDYFNSPLYPKSQWQHPRKCNTSGEPYQTHVIRSIY
jgi:hypothetical protein